MWKRAALASLPSFLQELFVKRLALCLLLCGCATDTTPGVEGQGASLDAGSSVDGELARDADAARDSEDGSSEDDDEDDDHGSDAGRQPGGKDAGALHDRMPCGYTTCPKDKISIARTARLQARPSCSSELASPIYSASPMPRTFTSSARSMGITSTSS